LLDRAATFAARAVDRGELRSTKIVVALTVRRLAPNARSAIVSLPRYSAPH
jgi:hypothetical protein